MADLPKKKHDHFPLYGHAPPDTQDCAECIQRMVGITLDRSPLAVLCFGFEDVFKSMWGFLPKTGG